MLHEQELAFADWESEVIAGNQFFNQSDFEHAKQNYKKAKKLATKLFDFADDSERAVAALVVSYHNLADLYQQKKQLKRAYRELDEVNAYLLNCLNKEGVSDSNLAAIRRGINKSQGELLNFIKRNNFPSTCISNIAYNKFNH